jgi:uncharacterized protein (DUF885 family)
LLDRRSLLLTGVAAVASPAAAQTADGQRLTALLDQAMQTALLDSPQLMTLTGFDKGPNAGAKHRLDDRSSVGVNRMRTLFEGMAAALRQFDPKTLTGGDLVNYRSAAELSETTLQSYRFPYGDPGVGGAIPYVVSQLSGSYRSVPTFLASQHTVASAEDAEAYLDRLAAFETVLDQETARAREHFALGAAPPDFVLRTTASQLAALLAPAPAASELTTNLTRRTDKIPGDWGPRAARIIEAQVYPALRRQMQLQQGALPSASREAGCWRLPDGEAYYRFAVRAFTTTDMSGEEIHKLGLDLVARLSSQADTILKTQGLNQGSVGQRIASLRRRPDQLYPNTDAGRAQLLADMNGMAQAMKTRLPEVFGALPQAPVEIARVPATIEAGAPGGSYQPPSVDGKRPGVFYINLRDTAEQPRMDLPTLVYHEVLPGHHLQNALALEAKGLPLLRRMPLFSGYSEGWALYAEQLADEMDVYRDNPLARVGYLASLLFRAARLVVDSGLHHKRWSREQAVRYMIDTLGEKETSVTREVERYCVQPGQASSYMLGHQVWTQARDAARAQLGARFDLRAFHDAGLLYGAMPLSVLTRHLEDWAKSGGPRAA